jgi:hypothetical protein
MLDDVGDKAEDSPDVPPAVVEFGADLVAAEDSPGRRLLTRLRADRRVVPVVAALGGAAALGSLLGEWRTYTFPERPPGLETGLPPKFTSYLMNLPAPGSAYLFGLFLVAASLVLALFGGAGVRRVARLVGLASAGVLAAVVVATTVHLDRAGGTEDVFLASQGGTVSYGRGLFLAYAAVAAFAVALWLAAPVRGRIVPPAAAPEVVAVEEPDTSDDELGPDWPWRPPPRTRAGDGAGGRPGPLDLTVEPAAPFVAPPDDGDER